MSSNWRYVDTPEIEKLKEISTSYPTDKSVSPSLLESIAGVYPVVKEGTALHPNGKVVTISGGNKICTRTDDESLIYEAVNLSVYMEGTVVNLKPGAEIVLLST
jgi:hypothetical protein